MHAQVAHIVDATRAEGPGLRMAIWFQGCPFRCPGCCNPEMLSFNGGEQIALDQIVDRMTLAREHHGIEGVTLLGGEPFAHIEVASKIADQAKQLELSVMVFSGYELDQLREHGQEFNRLLKSTDLLIDGPYDSSLPDTRRRWIGSTNQQIHFLTDRYARDDEYWSQSDTIEIRLEGDQLSVNGFPSQQATGLWKRPKKQS